MARSSWIAASGDWNTASNWSDGVPTAGVDAVFDTRQYGITVSGSGPAASLTASDPYLSTLTLTGTHAVGSLAVAMIGAIELAPGAALSFGSAVVDAPLHEGASLGATLAVDAGAALAGGTITLGGDGVLSGALGTLAGGIVVAARNAGDGTMTAQVAGAGRLSGLITRSGALVLSPDATPGGLVLENAANSWSGGVTISAEGPLAFSDSGAVAGSQGSVEVARTGALGTGPVSVAAGTLLLDPGVAVGAITAGTGFMGTVTASDQALTLYGGAGGAVLRNGSGHATVLGSVAPEQFPGGGAFLFGTMSVSGGTGRVTAYGGNEAGTYFGGTAGGNVIVAGAVLDGFVPLSPGNPYFVTRYANGVSGMPGDLVLDTPGGTTIGGGGDGDLLAGTGSYGLVIAAAGGNETLSGAASSDNDTLFGGAGSDLIVAGSGRSVVVAGSGAATINGGAGTAAIFAGAGQDVIVGGSGAAYVQAGAGNATVFEGGGAGTLGVVNGRSGGSVAVYGFRAGVDRIAAQGYAAGPMVSAAGGSTVLRFADATTVTLVGVTDLTAGG